MKKKRSRGQRVLSLLLAAVMFCGLWSFSGASVSEVYGAESLKPEAPALEGFLAPVTQKTEVPDGYTGIYTAAQLMAKENGMAQVRLPSGEVRLIRLDCRAQIGQVSNIDHENVKIGKAGKTRHRGIRPTVRGSVMNPCDHPHGGGEGRSPIGRPSPVTPWGKPALGYKTRDKKVRTERFIVKHRNGK